MDETFDLIEREIQDYCEAHTSEESDVLYRLYRETNLKVMQPRMLSCKNQGTFLEMISRLCHPKRILELGTYTGYSAICLAQGLADDGMLFTIEKKIELENIIRKYIHEAGLTDKIKVLFGNAMDIVPSLDQTWDLIFIDADKINYLNYYNLLIDRLSENGVILADNVLWSKKVVDATQDHDRDTIALRQFNDYIQQDKRVKNMILPFRDGIMMIEKVKK
ncbi:MAG: O-methyltransferase [Bacteroidales bacterium]|nr:O-methyltransferase [Bacteroidales bacterium]